MVFSTPKGKEKNLTIEVAETAEVKKAKSSRQDAWRNAAPFPRFYGRTKEPNAFLIMISASSSFIPMSLTLEDEKAKRGPSPQ